jgi:preprotein translocase subunit Sec61beta
MSKNNQVNMPMSGAGITRYFKDSQSKFKIKPAAVVIMLIIIISIVFILHLYGYNILGISPN